MKNIAIFASGNGSNAEAIARYFADSESVCVKCVLSNRKTAGVHQRMESLGIPTYSFTKEQWSDARPIIDALHDKDINLIVLAGFLGMIEQPLLNEYKDRIINIHPSLLPRYGGKGMWGHHVHEAVIAAGDKESGITIHLVTEEVDGGKILFQASCEVLPNDTPDTLATRIHALEHQHYPKVIEQLVILETKNAFNETDFIKGITSVL